MVSRLESYPRNWTICVQLSSNKFKWQQSLRGDPSTVGSELRPPALSYVPASKWTMEKKGATRIEVGGFSDKRQITALFAATLSGDFLPILLVHHGKAKRCHPEYPFSPDWPITHIPFHWSNEETMLEYINKIIVPYGSRKKKELGLPDNHHALTIYDEFSGQITVDVIAKLSCILRLFWFLPTALTVCNPLMLV